MIHALHLLYKPSGQKIELTQEAKNIDQVQTRFHLTLNIVSHGSSIQGLRLLTVFLRKPSAWTDASTDTG